MKPGPAQNSCAGEVPVQKQFATGFAFTTLRKRRSSALVMQLETAHGQAAVELPCEPSHSPCTVSLELESFVIFRELPAARAEASSDVLEGRSPLPHCSQQVVLLLLLLPRPNKCTGACACVRPWFRTADAPRFSTPRVRNRLICALIYCTEVS